MPIDAETEIPRLRAGLRDLVALSTVPIAWVGREPHEVASGLADALIGLLQLDFAYVRFRDPGGADAVEVMRGQSWAWFPDWLERRLPNNGRFSRTERIPSVVDGDEAYRGVVMPVGVDAEGGVVAAGCRRAGFPSQIDHLLLSLAANHAATAFHGARLIQERARAEAQLRRTRNELEATVAERTAALRRSEAYVAASRARIIDAADQERRRVVRDLHDGAQSRLVNAVIMLELASARDDLPPEVRPLVDEALAHSSAAIEELRELAHGIHPAILTNSGLRAAVEDLARRAPFEVEVVIPDERHSPPIESAAYFVVAEALTNVAKHAHARRAWVTITVDAGSLLVRVRDDGVGGALAAGSGLVGMQDRLAALDGWLEVISPPGGGTTVAADLPLAGLRRSGPGALTSRTAGS
jgi:signal transduction histidine kinase